MSIKILKERVCVAEAEFIGANVSCVKTDDGLVLIDTPCTPDEVRRWKANIAIFGNGRRVAYLINTDFHYDHCISNVLLSDTVIAHELTYENMLKPDGTGRQYFLALNRVFPAETKQQILDAPIGLPRITFNDRMSIHLKSANLELFHLGGHTEATIAIYLAEDRVLFSGDNVVASMHPYKGHADFRRWITGLEKILKMDVEVIVPGHGRICGRPEAVRLLEYFHEMWGRVEHLRDQGHSKQEVIAGLRDMLGYFPIDPPRLAQTNLYFDEGTARMYEQVAAA